MSVITVPQARGYAVAAGFTSAAVETIVAIAQAESGLKTDARNVNHDSHTFPDGHTGPSTDRGLVQINDFWHPEYSDAQCDDPAEAMRAAYAISGKGKNDFSPWSTFKSGAYKRYLIPRNPAPLSQLHEPTNDGHPDENANNNCGETALAWILRDLGTDAGVVGDTIHDEVIGQGVIGGSDLLAGSGLNPKYAAAAAKRGVTLTLYRGTQAELVKKCHEVMSLAAGDALANFGGGANYLHQFSDPAHYTGYGHICAIAHSVTGGLELMDPWIGGYRSYSDAELEQMIVWGYIVVATPAIERVSVPAPQPKPAPAPAPTPTAKPTPFYGLVYTSDPTVWHCPATNHRIGGNFLVFYQKVTGPFGETGTQILGLPLSDEYTGQDGKTRQDFERGRLVDEPHPSAPEWHITLDTLGHEAQALTAQVSDLTTQLANARRQITADQPVPLAPAPTPTTPSTPTTPTTPTTPAAAAALLVQLVWAQAEATLEATLKAVK